MTDFKPLIALLQKTVDDFNSSIPGIQDRLLDKLREELTALKLKQGDIQINAENIRKIAVIKSRLLDIILSPEYVEQVKQYVQAFNQITALQNRYFESVSDGFAPPDFTDALKQQAIESAVDNLTERGIQANVIAGIEDILRKNITGGGSYVDLQKSLENHLTNNEVGEGALQKYTRQMTVDAVNQYSAQYSQIVSSDLGLEWFIYAGSNIETTRPLCIALTKKRHIHVSEFPAILSGDFEEFRQADGKLNSKTGLPEGMLPDTTPSNFQINRGGWNCQHQLRPVSESAVPADKVAAVKATNEYRVWTRK